MTPPAFVKSGGIGHHLVAILFRTPSTLVTSAKLLLAFEAVCFAAAALPRISAVCLYLRIFSWQRGSAPWTVSICLIAILTLGWVAFTAVTFLQCTPISWWWDRMRGSVGYGRCINYTLFYKIQAVVNVPLDLVVVGLPVPTIVGLNLSRAKRVVLVVVFGVAGL